MAGKAGHTGEAQRHLQAPTPDPETRGSLDGVASLAACRARFPLQLTPTLRARSGPKERCPWRPGYTQSHTQGKEWQVRPVGSGPMPAIPVHARQASAWLLTQLCQDHPSHTQSQHHPGKERGGQRTIWTLSLFSAGH